MFLDVPVLLVSYQLFTYLQNPLWVTKHNDLSRILFSLQTLFLSQKHSSKNVSSENSETRQFFFLSCVYTIRFSTIDFYLVSKHEIIQYILFSYCKLKTFCLFIFVKVFFFFFFGNSALCSQIFVFNCRGWRMTKITSLCSWNFWKYFWAISFCIL